MDLIHENKFKKISWHCHNIYFGSFCTLLTIPYWFLHTKNIQNWIWSPKIYFTVFPCTVLYCTVQCTHCTVLYILHLVLYCTVYTLYCTVLYYTHCTVLYCNHCAVLYTLRCTVHIVLYCTHCTVLYTLYCTVHIILYCTHCSVLYTLYCTKHIVLYCTHCTVLYTLFCTVQYMNLVVPVSDHLISLFICSDALHMMPSTVHTQGRSGTVTHYVHVLCILNTCLYCICWL